jgi:formylmethanofuran dehydrogenase subunit E
MLDEDMKYRRGSSGVKQHREEGGGILPTTPTTSCSTDAARLYSGCAL